MGMWARVERNLSVQARAAEKGRWKLFEVGLGVQAQGGTQTGSQVKAGQARESVLTQTLRLACLGS